MTKTPPVLTLILLVAWPAAAAERPEAASESARAGFAAAIESGLPSAGEAIAPAAVGVPVPSAPQDTPGEAVEYSAVPDQSTVHFEATTRFGTFVGRFNSYTLTARINLSKPSESKVKGTLDMNSVTLVNRKLPGWLLRRALKASAYPTSELETTGVEPGDEPGEYFVDVDLTFRGELCSDEITVHLERVGEDLRLKGAVTQELSPRKKGTLYFDVLLRKDG